MDTSQQEMKDDIKYMRKELEGNGRDGLIKTVAKNTKFRWVFCTVGSLLIIGIGTITWVITQYVGSQKDSNTNIVNELKEITNDIKEFDKSNKANYDMFYDLVYVIEEIIPETNMSEVKQKRVNDLLYKKIKQ